MVEILSGVKDDKETANDMSCDGQGEWSYLPWSSWMEWFGCMHVMAMWRKLVSSSCGTDE